MLKWLLISILFTASSCWAGGVSDANRKLIIADKLRSSEPATFNQLLNELDSQRDSLLPKQRAHLNYLKLYQLAFNGQFEQALVVAADIIGSDANDLLKFRTNLTMVNIYAISQRWSEGLAYLSDALTILPSLHNEEMQQFGLLVSAMFYNQLGQFELGLDYAQRLKARTSEGRNFCLSQHLILEAKFKLEQATLANNEVQLALASCRKAGEGLSVATIHWFEAAQLIDNGDVTTARDYLLRNLAEAEQANYRNLNSKYYSLLAKAYFLGKNYSQAESFASKAIAQMVKPATTQSLMLSYQLLYQIAKLNNHHQSAFEYLELYSKANVSYLDEVNTKDLAYRLAQHTIGAQKNQAKLFRQQNQILSSENLLAASNAQKRLLYISLLVMIVTLLVFWIYKSRAVNQRLSRMAQYDHLTGTLARGYFFEVANSAIQYCRTSEQELSCIVFDLDCFKAINDNHGHDCGDWALQQVVEQCRPFIRNKDVFGRIGGEEFCIVLPGCQLDSAVNMAERCRQAICDLDTTPSGATFNLSASFGVTSVALSGLHLEKLVADADSAMYQSKHSSRNRVTKFSVTSTTFVTMPNNADTDIAGIASVE